MKLRDSPLLQGTKRRLSLCVFINTDKQVLTPENHALQHRWQSFIWNVHFFSRCTNDKKWLFPGSSFCTRDLTGSCFIANGKEGKDILILSTTAHDNNQEQILLPSPILASSPLSSSPFLPPSSMVRLRACLQVRHPVVFAMAGTQCEVWTCGQADIGIPKRAFNTINSWIPPPESLA